MKISASGILVLFSLITPAGLAAPAGLKSPAGLESSEFLDISSFGEMRYWTEETGAIGKELYPGEMIPVPQTGVDEWNLGFTWDESRDIDRLRILYASPVSTDLVKSACVQYWFRYWPQEPPAMPKIEDRLDDPWQGIWLTAGVNVRESGDTVEYTFRPLSVGENPNADHLPCPVTYRNTLKIRLSYGQPPPDIRTFAVYTPSQMEDISVRIEFGKNPTAGLKGRLSVHNGFLDRLSGWEWDKKDSLVSGSSWIIHPGNTRKGIVADLKKAIPGLPGSNDRTMVTIYSNTDIFSFDTGDLEKGPIYIPAYSVYITEADDSSTFTGAEIMKGEKIRDLLKDEPEQTYERAESELPDLDPTDREHTPRRLYLPLAADASWQKFALEWGGNFYMSKRNTKAMGSELKRCQWKQDVLRWEIGTGNPQEFMRPRETCRVSVVKNVLPVVSTRWSHQGFLFEEEAFVTLLEGPLSPYNPGRGENTPAILMVKLSVTNPAKDSREADIWLKAESVDRLLYSSNFIIDKDAESSHYRLYSPKPAGARTEITRIPEDGGIDNALHHAFDVPGGKTRTLYISVPFVGDVDREESRKIARLDYSRERRRVIAYWEKIIEEQTVFQVPEPVFNELARAVIPHIRIGVTKDPKRGLFMVPAASFRYLVYANEACFQALLLDRFGDFNTVSKYLETFVRLQGSKPFKGTYSGDQKDVFHGARISEEYDYTAHNYNLDHGTVLYALSSHFLYTRDLNWLEHVRPNMLRACDWIIDQCNHTKVTDRDGQRVLHYGLLPAGHLEDNDDWGFWFANNAYACLGLETAVKVFSLAGFPEADRLKKAAVGYREHLRDAVRRSAGLCPVVRLRDNTYVPYVPTRPYQRFRHFGPMKVDYYKRYGLDMNPVYRLSATREVLYGPMILINTGIIDADEPMAEWILDDWEDNLTMSSSMGINVHGWVDDALWFSRGGMVFQPNLQNPIKAYLRRNEIPAAIRHIYNNMVSCLYPDVNAFTEEYRMWGSAAGPFYKSADEARFVDALCDLLVMENGEELWLAPGTPGRWLEKGKKIELKNASTRFGKVSFVMEQGRTDNTIEARIECPKRNKPDAIWLFVRAPYVLPMRSVRINGKNWEHWDRDREAILLPGDEKAVHVVVSY